MPWSDLERARESAARLAQRTKAGGDESTEPAVPTYARLKPKAEAAAQPAITPPPLAPLAPEAAGGQSWNALLEWLREATHAHAVFVVDRDGLPVAQLGALPAQDVDALGARLSFAFDQAARMRNTTGALDSIFIELDGAWLSGVRVAAPTGSLLFAIVSPEPLSVALRDRLGTMLLEVLS